jgi:hypothetical protein
MRVPPGSAGRAVAEPEHVPRPDKRLGIHPRAVQQVLFHLTEHLVRLAHLHRARLQSKVLA